MQIFMEFAPTHSAYNHKPHIVIKTG